ncbi:MULTISPECIES: type IV pilin N-terminal domain-containing protein [Haloarcula]|uniref:type IV pilin N-terminal domain-containing protein n=1 Tax=Haloarcula TaxID=2237 RepID=UPI0023EC4BAA|nr:type IV pilin N-terminal domain-containing protein [Halomicroarcula sp. XH51]
MDIKRLIHDDDAVSPVIGVILMVAITVILAAVIASFVLGLGDQAQQTTPQASFSFDYTSGGPLDVTHDGGDSIEAQELYIRGSNLNSQTGSWDSIGSYSPTSEITAGNSLSLSGVPNNYDVRVVYETVEGDNSATLAQDQGPNA